MSAPIIPVLDSKRHKEDTVREEIISPILKALGYELDGEHRIERSPRLKHPYIMAGSRRFPITLVPDYLLYRCGKPFCILDAKSPEEDITKGNHMQQAFGYAIHPEVRVQYFALCNGTDFSIHHVSAEKPSIHIPLKNLTNYWFNLSRLIGTDGMQNELLPNDFLLDFGIFSERFGLYKNEKGESVIQTFMFVQLSNLMRATDELYVSHTVVDLWEGGDLLLTLVFDTTRYTQLLDKLPNDVSEELGCSMKRHPYNCLINTQKPIYISLSGILSNEVFTSTTHEFDQYRPLMVTEVIGNSSAYISENV